MRFLASGARHHDAHRGFYESFSDVIFATMAIFILLMTVFMVVIKTGHSKTDSAASLAAPKTVKAANQQAAAIRLQFEQEAELVRRKEQAAQRRDELQAMLAGLEEQLAFSQSALETQEAAARDAKNAQNAITIKDRAVDLVVVMDMSSSMADEVRELRRVINRMAQLFPYITKEFRIGLVVHAHRRGWDTLALSRIKRADEDGGASYRRVQQWLAEKRVRSTSNYVLEASQAAVDLFPRPSSNHHQIVMVIGDVGPVEYGLGGRWHPQSAQRVSALTQILTRFALGHEDRKVIMQFSGKDEVRRHKKHRDAQIHYREIASMSGASGTYSENPTTMFVDFLVASLKQK